MGSSRGDVVFAVMVLYGLKLVLNKYVFNCPYYNIKGLYFFHFIFILVKSAKLQRNHWDTLQIYADLPAAYLWTVLK